MKGITLTQPWATLVAEGTKHIETRSWATNHRGRILIHAAKGWKPADMRFAIELHHEGLLRCRPRDLPHGAIVAVADLAGVLSTDQVFPGEVEWRLGNFGARRFAWLLENVKALAVPMPWRGALAVWEGPDL